MLKGQIESSLHTTRDKAIFLASSADHSGAWISALPIASCGLRLDNEAIRVGIALRLGYKFVQLTNADVGLMWTLGVNMHGFANTPQAAYPDTAP